jgi:predicted ferric reductase
MKRISNKAEKVIIALWVVLILNFPKLFTPFESRSLDSTLPSFTLVSSLFYTVHLGVLFSLRLA